jgi:hypothetical protein
MATEVQNQNEAGVAPLVAGIVADFQDLVKQQLRLARLEVQADLRKSKESAALLAAGAGLCVLAAFAAVLALGHLLHWLGLPAGADPSALPLWAGFAVVCGVLLIAGWVLVVAGKKKLAALYDPLPGTVQALKENIEWKTKANPS